MRTLLRFLPLITLGALLLCAQAGVAQSALGYRIIVNAKNPLTEIDRAFLSRAFLKKTTRWPHGGAIEPVDQSPDSEVRRRFAEDVIGRSVTAIRNAWQQAIFSGRDVPPPELDSDAEVVRYVSKHPGAVGYVSPTANLGNARVLTVK